MKEVNLINRIRGVANFLIPKEANLTVMSTFVASDLITFKLISEAIQQDSPLVKALCVMGMVFSGSFSSIGRMIETAPLEPRPENDPVKSVEIESLAERIRENIGDRHSN